MPSKRSKSRERERKRIAREKRSLADKLNEQEKNKERMKKLRLERNEEDKLDDQKKAKEGMERMRSERTEEEKLDDQEKAKEGMKKVRSGRTEEEIVEIKAKSRDWTAFCRSLEVQWKKEENLEAKERMRNMRARKGDAKKELEFVKIVKKHEMRRSRKMRDGKEHLQDNLKSKRGMQLMKDKGNLKEFARRNGGKSDEMRDWELYYKGCKNNADNLAEKRPDIVQVLNEKIREEKEKERKRKQQVEEGGGDWLYSGEMVEYDWIGNGKPQFEEDGFEYKTLTKEELAEIRKQEDLQYKAILKARKEELNEKRREKRQEEKDLLKAPLDPLPVRPLCEYEELREKNIKEREEAMAKSGFFDNLTSYKKEIGLVDNQLLCKAQSGKKKYNEELK